MPVNTSNDPLPLGSFLNGYQLLQVLGRGGFGITYQARRAGRSGEMYAIKEFFPAGFAKRHSSQITYNFDVLPLEEQELIAESQRMFTREAEVICSLNHPNIVRGVEFFEANSTLYLVMEYVSGKTLRDQLRTNTEFRADNKTITLFCTSLCDALETVHRKNILHCDIKPDNIFLGIEFSPILIDFGGARISNAEAPATNSAFYSAIEQFDANNTLGPWTDIYGLSAVLYRCMTGGKLPDARERLALLHQTGIDSYEPVGRIAGIQASYCSSLIQLVDSGLRLLPRERPRTIFEWRSAAGFPASHPRTFPSRGFHPPPPPPPRRPMAPPSNTAGNRDFRQFFPREYPQNLQTIAVNRNRFPIPKQRAGAGFAFMIDP